MTRVRNGEKTLRVIQEAIALASAGVSTEAALTRLNVYDRRTIRDAARVLRKRKTAIETQAAALLMAASGGERGDVLAPERTAEERELIRLGPIEGFRQLSTRVPQLVALEEDIRARRDPWRPSQLEGSSIPNRLLRRLGKSQTAETLGFYQASLATLRERLKPLVGPEAQSSDPLVRSSLAYSWTLQYLLRVLGMDQPINLDDETD